MSPKIEPFNLNNLVAGDFVEVQGFEDDNGGITATEVEVKELSDVKVQGYATDAVGDENGGSMTILGVEFVYEASTKFEDKNDMDIVGPNITALIISIAATPQLVRIQDDDIGDGIGDGVGNGIADEIELE